MEGVKILKYSFRVNRKLDVKYKKFIKDENCRKLLDEIRSMIAYYNDFAWDKNSCRLPELWLGSFENPDTKEVTLSLSVMPQEKFREKYKYAKDTSH